MESTQQFIQRNARGIVYAAAFVAAAATYLAYSKGLNVTSDIGRAYGFLAFSFISLSLAVSPIRALFPAFKHKAALYLARRALGVSGFVFAFLHSAVPATLLYKWNLAIFAPALEEAGMLFGVAALAILFALAATSFDWAVRKMGRPWFTLHYAVYLAYPLIIAHSVALGSDFSRINVYSGSFLLIAAATVLLEAARAWLALSKKKLEPQPKAQ